MNYSRENNERNSRKKNKSAKKIRNKGLIIFFRVLLAVVLIGGFALCGAIVGAYLGIIDEVEAIKTVTVQPDKYTTKLVISSTGDEYDSYRADENREYAPFDQIPQNLKNAYIAIEDERFYKHNGIDLKSIARAVYVTVTTKSSEGGSTITQQLIKNTITKVNKNTIKTKLQEQVRAVRYEADLVGEIGTKEEAKDRILEIYLNTIGLHYNIYGVQTGAHYYFNKDVSELNLTECVVLAAITNRPTAYEPIKHADGNKDRAILILKAMLKQEYITESEYDNALIDLSDGENGVYARITGQRVVKEESGTQIHSWYSDAVFQQVVNDLQEEHGYSESMAESLVRNAGYTITLPINLEYQAIVDEVMENDSLFPSEGYRIDVEYFLSYKNILTDKETHLSFETSVYSKSQADNYIEETKQSVLDENDNIEITAERSYTVVQPQASFVIMDHKTGYVLAASGGRGKKETSYSFNRATQATRSPGSVFKVLASFAPALDMGKITAATPIDDRPYTYGTGSDPYSPKNHWGSEYKGLTTVRDAIKISGNVVTVQNMFQTGIDACFDYLLNFGFTSLEDVMNDRGQTDRVLSTALGGLTNGVHTTEVTAAYAMIANHGNLNKAKFYEKVIDRDGNVVLDATIEAKEPKQVLKPGTAYVLTDMMRDVITGTGGATGTAAKFSNSSMPISGKTGTTSDNKDLYFVASTPYYTAGIWFGYDDNKPMNLNNSRYHLIIWRTIMERIHEGLEVIEFERPDNIIEVNVCKDSGLLPTDLCRRDPRGGRVINEIFVSGTQPTDFCDVHQSSTVCTVSGMRPNEYCPTSIIGSKVGIVKKDHYTGTAFISDSPYEIYLGGYCTIHSPSNNFDPVDTPISTDDNDDNLPIISNPPVQSNQPSQEPPDDQPEPPPSEEPTPSEFPEEIYIYPSDSGSDVPYVDDFISP